MTVEEIIAWVRAVEQTAADVQRLAGQLPLGNGGAVWMRDRLRDAIQQLEQVAGSSEVRRMIGHAILEQPAQPQTVTSLDEARRAAAL